MLFLLAAGKNFDGFHGVSLVALVAAGVVAAVWALLFALRWAASFPRLPDAGPETSDLGPEPPAVANLLANRWKVTRTAIPATLLDLAARRVVGIDLVGQDNYVVRLRDGDSTREKLTPYEQQVLDLVKSRATGGSCPVEALDLGEPAQAAGWVKRFDDYVVDDARSRGLARSRWRTVDWVIIGGGLAVVFGLLASAFALAHLAEGAGTTDKWAREDWFWVGGVAWLVAMFAISRTQDLRDTREGQAACARWLGVRNYFRNAHAFDNAQAAAVVIWERNLSYGVGLGAAHEAAHDLPFVADDPGEAWTRYSGQWRQVRVHYPRRFGYGQSPLRVFMGGLGRVVLWGTIGFVALPIVGRILWDLIDTLLSQGNREKWSLALVGGFIAFFSIAGTYLTVRFLAGVIRLWRGAADLGKEVTLEGPVVKVHEGYLAVDDGHAEELAAFIPGLHMPTVSRGMKVRVTMTPHLHFVKSGEVIERAPVVAREDAPGAAPPAGSGATIVPVQSSNLDELVRTASGLPLVPSAPIDARRAAAMADTGAAVHTFSDGQGNTVAVTAIGGSSAPGIAIAGFMLKRVSGSHAVEGLGGDAFWMRDTELMLRKGNGMTLIHVDLKDRSSDDRLKVARAIAEGLASP